MYILQHVEEIETGLHFIELIKDTVSPREGFKELGRKEYLIHMDAVKALLRDLKETCKYNKSIDPNYLPPSKRGRSFKQANRKGGHSIS